MADDDFELWLGRSGSDRPFAHRMRAAVNRAGGFKSRGRSKFTGARIGRGAGVGRVLVGTGSGRGWPGRRVVVKTSIVKLGGKGLARATAHMRYLQRDGTTREGERGALYGRENDAVDGKAFVERGAGDRHQFRFIVAPEDGAEYQDLKPFVRAWMSRIEDDLHTRLDWVAVDHFNTGRPHSHVIVRGKDDLGKDLIIAREYLTEGLRLRAGAQVDLDLGPRTRAEIERADRREIEQERFTNIDRRLLTAQRDDGLVTAAHRDGVEQSLRAGRLQTLGRMGLALEEKRGAWRLAPDVKSTLTTMGERNDIIRTMQRAMTAAAPERSPADYAVFDPHKAAEPIVGRVIARGLSDEHGDRQYVIVDALDGRSHFIDIGIDAAETTNRSIVRISAVRATARPIDYTIAEVAAAADGRYDVDRHLRHDPSATETFAETHVRRLEAIRRATGAVERQPNGTWIIASNHVDRALAYERVKAERQPVAIETLSERPLDKLAGYNGATWLDRELVSERPVELGRGFGADVRGALDTRRQWLVAHELAEADGDTVRYRRNLLTVLQLRELRALAGGIERELDKAFVEARTGNEISGAYRRAIQVGDAKFALIERAHDFSLVPWKPVLERAVGKEVSGSVRDSGISWTLGRSRVLGI